MAVTLYAADPNILAHAALATSDLAAAFLLPASASVFWWQLAAPTPRRVTLSAVVFGLTCVAKYSAVLLIPVFAGLLLWRIAADRRNLRDWLKRSPALVAVHVAGAVAMIWLFYGFRYSGFSPALPPADHYASPWNQVLPYIGWQGRVVEWCREWRLLPEAVSLGLRVRPPVLAGARGVPRRRDRFLRLAQFLPAGFRVENHARRPPRGTSPWR